MNFEQATELYKEGKFQEALEIYNGLIRKNPNQTQLHLNRGRVLSRLGKTELAIVDFDLIVDFEPYNTDFISDRAVVLHLLKRNEEALVEFDRATNLDPNNPYRYSSRAYFKDRIGDLNGAIQDYDKAIELDPEDAVAYNNRGMVEEKVGYQARAKKSFKLADDLVGYKTPEPTGSNDTTSSDSQSSNESKAPLPKIGNSQIPRKSSMSIGHYWQTFISIFTDSKTREDFANYLKKSIGGTKS